MMTARQIRDLAKAHGLKVDKRITTGTDLGPHFASFEVFGPRDAIEKAHAEARPQFDAQALRARAYQADAVTNPEHPEYGSIFLHFQHVWCDGENT